MAEQRLSIYLETSVWSFALAEDAPDYRADTEELLERCRKRLFEPYVSDLVLQEIGRSQPDLRRRLEGIIADVRPAVFPVSRGAMSLADAFLAARVVPASKPEDAGHVAAAFDQRLDVLVSWNFRHIANVRRAERFNAVAILHGLYHQLRIVSPSEVIYAQEDS